MNESKQKQGRNGQPEISKVQTRELEVPNDLHLFLHSFYKYLLSTSCDMSNVPGAVDTAKEAHMPNAETGSE